MIHSDLRGVGGLVKCERLVRDGAQLENLRSFDKPREMALTDWSLVNTDATFVYFLSFLR